MAYHIYNELIGKGNVAVIDENFAPNFIDHNFAPEKQADINEVKRAFIEFRKAFPDSSINIEDMLAEEDKVVTRSHGAVQIGVILWEQPCSKQVLMSVIGYTPFCRWQGCGSTGELKTT